MKRLAYCMCASVHKWKCCCCVIYYKFRICQFGFQFIFFLSADILTFVRLYVCRFVYALPISQVLIFVHTFVSSCLVCVNRAGNMRSATSQRVRPCCSTAFGINSRQPKQLRHHISMLSPTNLYVHYLTANVHTYDTTVLHLANCMHKKWFDNFTKFFI